jgi:hypothetical protein
MGVFGVTIDTSVFKDYLNPEKNTDDHIDKLLSVLAKRKYRLCVDEGGRIDGEYKVQIGPIIQNRDEGGFERQMLAYWLVDNPRIPIPTDMGDELMVQIKRIIIEIKETLDRIFVYVAIRGQSRLVTNDGIHIVARRKELRKAAKKDGAPKDKVDFLHSLEATANLAEWE